MLLPPPHHIAESKLTQYLLIPLPKDDKSNYLALAGYSTANWSQLEHDLLELVRDIEAVLERISGYGTLYSVSGQLKGPNGRLLRVKTIWMHDVDEEITKFITLHPPN